MSQSIVKSLYSAAVCTLLAWNSLSANGPQSIDPAETLLRARHEVTYYGSGQSGTPNHISGILSQAVTADRAIPETFEFLRENRDVFQMTNPELELAIKTDETDRYGVHHLRFDQYHRGVKVYGREMTAHFDRDGYLKTITGEYLPGVDVETTPALTADEAVAAATVEISKLFLPRLQDSPQLVIYRHQGIDYLCWQFHLLSSDGASRRECFVDARTGELIWHISRIMHTPDVGSGLSTLGFPRNHVDVDFTGGQYLLTDYTRQANYDPFGRNGQMPDGNVIQTHYYDLSFYPGNIGSSFDNTWDDLNTEAPMVDAHVYAGLVYDWMLRELGRNSYDDNGSTMQSVVSFAGQTNNAFFNGNSVQYLYWGGGWRSLAGCPDVVAHEWGHGVTGTTSGLFYQHESGALNESFSDMMGAAFEFSIDSLDAGDWFVAENGPISGGGFRNMADPNSFNDPDTYEGVYWVNVVGCVPSDGNDYCGVHTNSNVGNKWFYLLSDGGTHNGVTVTGIGSENAIKIAYQANKYYWTPTETYPQAALATVSASDDLDSTYLWSISVADAWTAVGLPVVNPILAFSADSTFGWVPLSVNFTGSSQKTVLSWTWDFDDGGSSLLQSPSHTYTQPGWYSVECAIDTGGGGRALRRPQYIAALADSMIALDAGGAPGGSLTLTIYARNTIPVRVAIVPVEFAGSIGLTYDSISIVGCRSSALTTKSLSNFDPFNSRLTARIQGPTPDVLLDPGTGPILKVHFTVPTGTDPGATNPLYIDGYNTFAPSFLTNIRDYTTRFENGTASLCETRGNIDGTGPIDVADLTYLVQYMFKSGPPPQPLLAADVNCTSVVDIGDLTYLVMYMFKSGPPPCSCS